MAENKENKNDIINILENEIACVRRANYCTRQCEKCDLVLKDTEIIDAYNKSIRALKNNTKYRKAFKRFKRKYVFLKVGIRRALNEISDTADADAYTDYQLGVNYGLMLAFKIIKKYIKEDL